MENLKSCPFCGNSNVKYKESYQSDGNCSYKVGFIVCDCGIRTDDLIVDGYYGETTTKEDVYKIWNTRQ